MKRTDDPKKVLRALLSEAPEPLPFDDAVLEQARALARSPETATREAVEALPEALALAVLEAAVKAKRVELAAALQESANKTLAKGARKGLYALKSAGVQVPERARAAPPPATVEEPNEEWLPCWLSPPTGDGERALLAVRAQKGGGLELAQVLVDGEHGIKQCNLVETNRSSYRKQMRELRSEEPMRAMEIALEEARLVLAESAALNLATGTPFPEGTEEALRHFGVAPSGPPEDLPAPLPDDERLATQAQSIHMELEAQSWLPPEPDLKVLAQKMDVVITSPLQLTPVQKEEQLHGVVRAAAAEFFTPPVRKRYARRLWQLADYLERTGRDDRAKVARAEARRLFHDVPERPDRFEEFLFEKVLILSRAIHRGEQLPEPGAPPAEPHGEGGAEPPDAEPAQPGERRSPGGLILP